MPNPRRSALFGIAAACLLAGCLDALRWSGNRLDDSTSFFRSEELIAEAAGLAARARELGAERAAPYEVARAEEYLRLARAKHASGDYPAAETLAAQAKAAAESAVRLQAERAGAPPAENRGGP